MLLGGVLGSHGQSMVVIAGYCKIHIQGELIVKDFTDNRL